MNEDRLRRLLHETVDDLAPADRLDEIRARTHDREAPPTRRYAVLVAAAAATAAVVGTVAWAGGVFDPAPEAPPAQQSTTAPSGAPGPSDDATSAPGEEPFTVAVYWVGQTPEGWGLYREFQQVAGSTQLEAAVDAAISGAPADPDYMRSWPDTELLSASVRGDRIHIDLDEASSTMPEAVNPAVYALALEQVVRTAQAAVGSRLPVQFLVDGNPVAEIFGEPTAEPRAEGEWSEVLSLVSLSDPAEGTTVTGDALSVAGVASSFEATVPWRILQDGSVVDDGFFTAEGWADRLHPFGGDIDVTGLAPDTYVLEVSTSDPSGGEGPGPFTDTRTFVVR